MRSKNIILLSLLATVLMCSAAVSLAAAEPNVSSATAPPFDPKATPPPPIDGANTNMPIITPDDGTYHILDNQTSANGNPEPGGANNLIAPAPYVTEAVDYTIPIVIGSAIAVAAGLGAVAAVYYRKQEEKEEN